VRLSVRGKGEIEGRGVEIYKERNGGRVEEREGGGYSESETNNKEREKEVVDVGEKERRDSGREGER
jgi:hypothetical protein